MIIWGNPVMISLNEVLQDIKTEAMHKKINLELDTLQSSNDIFITCPHLEGHNGVPENTPSCSVNKDTGIVHCFGCGYSDSLPGMIAKIFKLSNKVMGYRWILQKYAIPAKGYRPLIKLEKIPRQINSFFLPDSILDQYSYDHPYMFKRHLTEDIIDLFDLGFDKQTNSITIPMRDHKGRLVFIKKRPVTRTKFHKYHIDEGIDKRGLVFGLDIIAQNIGRVKMIYLCEGEFDVMSCYVAKKYAGGMQGDSLFGDQVKQLIRVARGIPICILTDNDQPGREARNKAIPMLRPYFPLYKPIYPMGGYKDPNDLLRAGLLESLQIEKIL
jgi:DNA primase